MEAYKRNLTGQDEKGEPVKLTAEIDKLNNTAVVTGVVAITELEGMDGLVRLSWDGGKEDATVLILELNEAMEALSKFIPPPTRTPKEW